MCNTSSDIQDPGSGGHLFLRISGALLPWLTEHRRNRRVVLLDFDADLLEDDRVRFDLNVIFNPRSVRRGLVNRADYYIGSTGAEITLQCTGSSVMSFSTGKTVDVKHTNTVEYKRESSLTLQAMNLRGDADGEASPATISRKAASTRTFNAEFLCNERQLTTTDRGDSIKWSLTLPRGEKAYRDFLAGNLYLFAEFRSASGTRGFILTRPSDIRFFDSDRRPLTVAQSLVMHYVLWRDGVRIDDIDGSRVDFEEIANERI